MTAGWENNKDCNLAPQLALQLIKKEQLLLSVNAAATRAWLVYQQVNISGPMLLEHIFYTFSFWQT